MNLSIDEKKIAPGQPSSGKNNLSAPVFSHIQHPASFILTHSFLLSLPRRADTPPLWPWWGLSCRKTLLLPHRIPFQSCLVIKKGLHGEGSCGWGGGEVGGGATRGIGLVGNLAKKQRADLLCSWQALEAGTHEPDSPADTQPPPLRFCSVCVGMWREGGQKRKERLCVMCVRMYFFPFAVTRHRATQKVRGSVH